MFTVASAYPGTQNQARGLTSVVGSQCDKISITGNQENINHGVKDNTECSEEKLKRLSEGWDSEGGRQRIPHSERDFLGPNPSFHHVALWKIWGRFRNAVCSGFLLRKMS